MKVQPVTMGVFHGGQLEQEMMKPFILMIQVCFEQIDKRDVTWKSYRNRVFFPNQQDYFHMQTKN